MKTDSRTEILARFEKFFSENDLNEVYGCITGKKRGKAGRNALTLSFCRAVNLDGVLEVWGPCFIRVHWMTRYNKLPHVGHVMFRSEAEAMRWFKEQFGR